MSMKRLLLDIETAPNVVASFRVWNTTISPKDVITTGYTLCWSAKWLGERGTQFDSIHKSDSLTMLRGIWTLLDEADAVISYNGSRFDSPTLSKEFLKHGLLPPSPYKHIDLLKTVRNQFRLPAGNQLDMVLRELGMNRKLQHQGIGLWLGCMNGDEACWKKMERYNRRDVVAMEPLYLRLLPWIKQHPNFGLYVDDNRPVCNKCGSAHLQARGVQRTATMVYQRYQCNGCGSWLQERRNNLPARKKDSILREAH